MTTTFYDRSNNAGGGSFYDRTNDADAGSAQAFGALASAIISAFSADVLGYTTVTLADPLYLGRRSILSPTNFTGTPVAGAVVRYPTTDGFTVVSDGTVYANVNTGTYVCYYDEGSGEIEFSVTLDDHIDAFADLGTATASGVDASAVGGIAGLASGDIATATIIEPFSDAYESISASGQIGTALSVVPAGSASAPSFPGVARGAIGLATASRANGSATGAANALGAVATGTASAPVGMGNETGVGLANGQIAVAIATTVDGRGFAQWGRVEKNITIWTRVN